MKLRVMSRQNDCCQIVDGMLQLSSPISAKSPMPKDASMSQQTRQLGSNLAGSQPNETLHPQKKSKGKMHTINVMEEQYMFYNICKI